MGLNYEHLSAEEHGVIFAMKVQGCSARAIAHGFARARCDATASPH